MQRTTIATFDDPVAARELKNRFDLEGLPAELHDERRLQRFWFLSKPHACFQVRVATEDYECAVKLYRELDAANDNVVLGAFRCPQCRSSRIEYPQMTRHFVLPTLFGHLIFLLGLKRKFYCQQCQHTWTDQGEHVSRIPHRPADA